MLKKQNVFAEKHSRNISYIYPNATKVVNEFNFDKLTKMDCSIYELNPFDFSLGIILLIFGIFILMAEKYSKEKVSLIFGLFF